MLFETVIIATDFSPGAEKIFACLKELQEVGTKKIILVWVVESKDKRPDTLLKKIQLTKLHLEKAELETRGFQVEVEAPIGIAYQEIHRAAHDHKADLIVITSRGKNLVRDFFIGSTVSKVIRSSSLPVLVERVGLALREGQNVCEVMPKRFDRILLATDFSTQACNAEKIAMELSCLSEKTAIISVIDEGVTPAEIKEKKEEAQAYLENLRKDCLENCPELHILLEVGIASKKILQWAQEFAATLIIMGTKGKSNMPNILLGSTAENVARQANCSVLLIP